MPFVQGVRDLLRGYSLLGHENQYMIGKVGYLAYRILFNTVLGGDDNLGPPLFLRILSSPLSNRYFVYEFSTGFSRGQYGFHKV